LTVSFLTTGPDRPIARFVCAHGAGGAMDSPFLNTVATLLADRGLATLRFEFAYMAARRQGGARKPPSQAERLMVE
jgi:predicted alpha/beta-hydrolase family hydrolase